MRDRDPRASGAEWGKLKIRGIQGLPLAHVSHFRAFPPHEPLFVTLDDLWRDDTDKQQKIGGIDYCLLDDLDPSLVLMQHDLRRS